MSQIIKCQEMAKDKVKIHNLNNYEEFTKLISNTDEELKNVYFLFTGKKKENGQSWCIYCQLGLCLSANFEISM